MPYSILIWLNTEHSEPDPGVFEDQSPSPAGAATGALNAPPHDRLVYGFYEEREEADAALELLAATLRQQAPIRISRRQDRQFIIPAGSVRYVACEEVERPRDNEGADSSAARRRAVSP